MDTVNTLTETVRQAVRSYARRGYNAAGERDRLYYVENPQDQVFAILAAWNSALKRADLVLMARIVDDQVIIEQDKTSVSLWDELQKVGVPKEQIIWKHS